MCETSGGLASGVGTKMTRRVSILMCSLVEERSNVNFVNEMGKKGKKFDKNRSKNEFLRSMHHVEILKVHNFWWK